MPDIDKEKTCCFFGHRKIEETEKLKNNLCEIIENLIVNEKVDKLKKQSSKMSNQMAAVLSCINIADEYFKLKKTEDELIKNVVEYTDKIEKLELELANLRGKEV